MKSNKFLLLVTGVLLLVFYGCSDDNPLSTEVTEVASLYAPADGFDAVLDPNGNLTFEWERAKAEDGGMVMYEVAFDVPGGDFSSPVYRVVSDNNGVQNRATISHATLNSAASQAGLGASETGLLEWTVISSRGVNEKVSPNRRSIQITRLAGFANPPNRVYLTGSGSEAGGNLADAIQMKSVGDGQFEIYAELTSDGEFSFVSSTSDDAREFNIIDGNLMEGGDAPVINQDGVYRLFLDFTIGNTSITRIDEVGFWYSAHGNVEYILDYQGNGVFSAENIPFDFFEFSWGMDSRYKFRLTVNKDGEESYEFFGSSNADNPDPTDATPESFWYLFPVDDSQWDYTYKMKSQMDESIIDIHVYFSPDLDNYTHEVIRVGDQ